MEDNTAECPREPEALTGSLRTSWPLGNAEQEIRQKAQCVYAALDCTQKVENYGMVKAVFALKQTGNPPTLPLSNKISIVRVLIAQMAPEPTLRIKIRRTRLFYKSFWQMRRWPEGHLPSRPMSRNCVLHHFIELPCEAYGHD